MKTYICSLVVTILVSSACDNGKGPTSPDSPSPAVYTLSGMVTETTPSGSAPLEGALVRDDGGQETLTGDDGLYTFAYTRASATIVRTVTVSKDGYTTIHSSVRMSADTRRDLQMSRIVTYTLSGVVFESTASGRVPIEGVQVYCDGCGHDFQRTDANGQYLFERATNGAMPLLVDLPGYALAGNQPVGSNEGSVVATVEGDTRFDIELVRR